MKRNLPWMTWVALMCVPMAASAQQAPHTPAPPAADAPAFPESPVDDEGQWLDDDDVLAMGFEDWYADAGDLAEGGPGAGGPGAHMQGPGGHMQGPGGHMQGPGAHMRGPGMHMRGGMRMRHGGAMMLRLSQLDLSDAQRDKLRDLHEAQARKAVQRRADLQLARMDLHKLMRADKPDPAAINAQIDRLAKLQADGMKSRTETMLAARNVLTPEQWKKLHSGPMGPGGGKGPGKGGPGMGHGMMMHGMGDAPKH